MYHGEVTCSGTLKSGKSCTQKAYYKSKHRSHPYCGRHAKQHKGYTTLPKNPNADREKQLEIDNRQQVIDRIAKENREQGKKGDVICSKFLMMRQPKLEDVYLAVFPNFKHGNRKDGYGCDSLSPKSLGPVKHRQPGLPDALTIENYHQFNKVFSQELDPVTKNPIPEFYEKRNKGYQDSEPHRHKIDPKEQKKKQSNINIPLFSIHLSNDGQERRYSYVQSRYFYCHQYELLTKDLPQLNHLQELIENGTNLQIIGYDGYPITNSLYDHYLDISRPFGHELVLYSILTIENSQNYPWNRYYNEFKEIYE